MSWKRFIPFLEDTPAPAPEQPFREAAGVTVDDDEEGWRRISGDSHRDLSPMTQRRMRKLALYLWEANLLANRIVELPVAYLLAEGVQLQVDEPDAQGWLDSFWHDPINCMDIKLPRKVREMKLFGEQCWPVFVNPISGHTRLGYLDPERIATVVSDPDNAEQPVGIITTKNTKGVARRYRIIVNGPEHVFSERTREIRESFTDGECFYFAKNTLSNGQRGRSDLLCSADYIDAYDQFLFGELERGQHLRSFVWDVTLKGATPEQVEERARQIASPSAGSVRVHNEAEEWDSVSPELGQYETAAGARLFRGHILGGATIPEHWFGTGGDVNRATAGEMGEPTFKVFSMEQRLWKHILEEVATFVIRRRLDPAGASDFDPEELDRELLPQAVFPEMTTRDTSSYATALQQVVFGAATAVDRGLLSEQTALELIASVAGRLGVEIDTVAELETARRELSRRREDDVFVDPPDETPEEGSAGTPEA